MQSRVRLFNFSNNMSLETLIAFSRAALQDENIKNPTNYAIYHSRNSQKLSFCHSIAAWDPRRRQKIKVFHQHRTHHFFSPGSVQHKKLSERKKFITFALLRAEMFPVERKSNPLCTFFLTFHQKSCRFIITFGGMLVLFSDQVKKGKSGLCPIQRLFV
jgi:hypothetical protein